MHWGISPQSVTRVATARAQEQHRGACSKPSLLLTARPSSRARNAIIARAQARVASRAYPKPSDTELTNGIPVFLDQLGDALRLAKLSDVIDHDQIRESAGRHGGDLLRMGLTVAQVVRDYGDVCQAITELAVEQHAPIPPEEFRTLNLCLDDAIAEAVTEYGRQREGAIEARGTERLGNLAHELRNHLNTAAISFEMIRVGQVTPDGSTGPILGRSLIRDLIDRSLADVRLDAGIERLELISVAAFLEEVEIGARGCSMSRQLAVSPLCRSLRKLNTLRCPSMLSRTTTFARSRCARSPGDWQYARDARARSRGSRRRYPRARDPTFSSQ